MQKPLQKGMLFLLVVLILTVNQATAQQAAEILNIDDPVSNDVYLAGRSVNILAAVSGDAVIAGQRINVAEQVSEDVIAAGERINLSADVGDDVRAAGRMINLNAVIGDDAILAGETVTLGPDSIVSNRAWIAGRSVELAGQIGMELRAAAKEITISGEIGGNVHVIAENIEVYPGVKIEGDFIYKSPSEANIAPGATISGKLIRQEMDLKESLDIAVFPSLIFTFLTLLLSFAVVSWLFPAFMAMACDSIFKGGFKSIGIGLVFSLLTPVIVVLLLISVIGIPLGLILLALYPIVLFIGFLLGVYFLSDAFLRRIGKDVGSFSVWRLVAALIAMMAIVVVLLVPLLGGIVLILLILLGLGGVLSQLYSQYRVQIQ